MLSIVFARVIRSRVVSDCQESYWWKTDPTMCACVFGGGGDYIQSYTFTTSRIL